MTAIIHLVTILMLFGAKQVIHNQLLRATIPNTNIPTTNQLKIQLLTIAILPMMYPIVTSKV